MIFTIIGILGIIKCWQYREFDNRGNAEIAIILEIIGTLKY